jgi:hypothetical protein
MYLMNIIVSTDSNSGEEATPRSLHLRIGAYVDKPTDPARQPANSFSLILGFILPSS